MSEDKDQEINIFRDLSNFANENQNNISKEGGFIKDDEIPQVQVSKKPFPYKYVILGIAISVVIAGSYWAVNDALTPTYREKDFGLPHECVLQIMMEEEVFKELRLACNPDKFYNDAMFRDIENAIESILESEGIGYEQVNVRPVGLESPEGDPKT